MTVGSEIQEQKFWFHIAEGETDAENSCIEKVAILEGERAEGLDFLEGWCLQLVGKIRARRSREETVVAGIMVSACSGSF